MPDTTIIALFDRFADARAAHQDLLKNGIPADWLGLMVNNTGGDHPAPITNPSFALPQEEPTEQSTEELGLGLTFGAGVGALIGGAIEFSALLLPGIGPVIAAGLWIPLYAGIGSVIGGAVAALKDQGIPLEDAELYQEGLRRGGTLLAVHANERDVHMIYHVMSVHGACDIEERGRHWRADGWVGFAAAATDAAADESKAPVPQAGDDMPHRRARRHRFPPAATKLATGVSTVTTHYGEDMLKG